MTDKPKERPPSQQPQARSDRYHQNDEVRQDALDRSRRRYRVNHGEPDTVDVLGNLHHLMNMAEVRACTVNGKVRPVELNTVTRAEVADALERTPKVLGRWIADGKFPAPVITAMVVGANRDYAKAKGVAVPVRVGCYTVLEAELILTELHPHLSTVAYYRADHVELIARVNKAAKEARKKLNLPTR